MAQALEGGGRGDWDKPYFTTSPQKDLSRWYAFTSSAPVCPTLPAALPCSPCPPLTLSLPTCPGTQQTTVNNQIVVGTLMNMCDSPNQVSLGSEWREGDFINRVPIIVTGQ